MTKIYLVTNCYDNPNKVYIGKTKANRYNNHTRTFGKQISYVYIDEVDSLNRKDWKPLEIKWIQYYKYLGYDVLNKNNGGGGVSFHTEETKFKMSKPKSDAIKLKIKNTLKGNKHINHKKGKEHGNYGKKRSEEHLQKMTGIKKPGVSIAHKGNKKPKVSEVRSKSILQYDLQGNLIKDWPNSVCVNEVLNIKMASICNVLKGRAKTAGGFFWQYK
jgi:hypothetical protein